MKVSFSWLKQYVDIDVSPDELAERLTMVGLAVEHVEKLGHDITNVVVGKILEIKDHPQADKLVVCSIDIGREVVQIVTGASNVRSGQRVPVAIIGAKLPGGMEIKKADFRGVASYGMLCSAQELNIDEALVSEESRKGILILNQDAPLGEDLIQVMGLDDTILEFELTPNRSDCLSVINIAREVGSILGKEVTLPTMQLAETEEQVKNMASVEVIDQDLCNRYVAKIVKNINIAPSPLWMQHYLRCSGIRPINNVVDISNYVMLETGQPLHTFDFDRLADSKIIVRRALEGEEMVTLDGQKRIFSSETLLICDGEKPVAVAGVMGGLDTEVSPDTRNILIEAARFHPVSVRRASRLLGLRSESSLRFEKGLDVANVAHAANRAAQLLANLAGGIVVGESIDTFTGEFNKNRIQLRTSKVNEILGTDLSTEKVSLIMKSLCFGVEVKDEEMEVTIPSYRQDIIREIDLIEEVARINGYDNIPISLPFGITTEGRKTKAQNLEDITKNLLTGAGLTEVITFSFISPKDLDKINLSENSSYRNVVTVKNPLSDEQSIMRTTLAPGLLEVASRNNSRRNTNLAIFECGRVFISQGNKLPYETIMLGALGTGKFSRGWNSRPQDVDFYFLKGVLNEIFQRFGINDWKLEADSLPHFLHPGRSGRVIIGNQVIGYLGEIHPLVQEKYDLENRTYLFEVNLNSIIEAASVNIKYAPVAKYPAVERDMALLAKDSVPAGAINDVICASGGDILSDVNLFDVYKGTQIPEGYKSLAYSLLFQAKDRTLVDEEVSQAFERITKSLFERLEVELR